MNVKYIKFQTYEHILIFMYIYANIHIYINFFICINTYVESVSIYIYIHLYCCYVSLRSRFLFSYFILPCIFFLILLFWNDCILYLQLYLTYHLTLPFTPLPFYVCMNVYYICRLYVCLYICINVLVVVVTIIKIPFCLV